MPLPPSCPFERRISARAICPATTATIGPITGRNTQVRMPNTRLTTAAVLFGGLDTPSGALPGATHCGAARGGATGAPSYGCESGGFCPPYVGGSPTVGVPLLDGAATRDPQFGQNSAPGTTSTPQVVQ